LGSHRCTDSSSRAGDIFVDSKPGRGRRSGSTSRASTGRRIPARQREHRAGRPTPDEAGPPHPSDRAAGVQLRSSDRGEWIAETPGRFAGTGWSITVRRRRRSRRSRSSRTSLTISTSRPGLRSCGKRSKGSCGRERIDAPFDAIFVTAARTRRSTTRSSRLRPGGRGDPSLPVLLQPRDGGHLASAVPVPVPSTSAFSRTFRRSPRRSRKGRARSSPFPNNPTGRSTAGDAGGDSHALRGARYLPLSATRRTNISRTTAPGTSPRLPRRRARDLLYSSPRRTGWRAAGRVPRGAGTSSPRLMKIQDTVVVSGPAISSSSACARCAKGEDIARRTFLPRESEEEASRGSQSSPTWWRFPRDGRLLPVREGEFRNERHRPVGTARAGAQGPVIPGRRSRTRGCWLRIAYGSLRERTAWKGSTADRGLRAILAS